MRVEENILGLNDWRTAMGKFGWEVPDPEYYEVTRWRRDPYALGSWTYAPIGTKLEQCCRVLCEPLGDEEHGLYLCGEACSNEHIGTVNGTCVS